MAKITINGTTFEVEGNNISIKNESIWVNGKKIIGKLKGVVKVKFEGDLANLDTDASVECGNIKGSVNAGGSVTCGDVGRMVDAGGSVKCDKVGGNIDAGGSVNIS